ncbi:Uncharacterised protein [Mycobacterium tuberculosis]|nr:Uncharacterised protein [Mycobacterium tuberculosis]CPA63163.1 Uncharacterised protein [Mycobacterium tuberculosis]
MDVATDLHRTIAGVDDPHLQAGECRGVHLDITTAVKDFSGNHAIG